MTAILAASLLPLLMMIAGIGDFLSYRIPNWLNGIIALSFVPMAVATGMPLDMAAIHIATGAVVLALGFGIFALGLVGGGDAKMMAAAAIWFGWPAVLQFLVFTVIAGGVLAVILALRAAVQVNHDIRGHTWMERWKVAKPDIPYGIAFAAGAILAFPQSWWMNYAA